MNITSWLTKASGDLAKFDIDSALLDAQLLLAAALCKQREYLLAHGNEGLSDHELLQANNWLYRRLNREPIAYILGHKEFYGRDFIVSPNVLIPRPESEIIIELFKRHKLAGRVLDVGTGSGCIGLTLKAEHPDISLTMSDISEPALHVARKNAKKLNIKPVRFIKSDLLSHWLSHKKPKKIDVIVANLPYVDTAWDVSPETSYEPHDALYSRDSGLSHIKKLITQAQTLQSVGGHLLLEADTRQHSKIQVHCRENGYELVELDGFVAIYKHQVLR